MWPPPDWVDYSNPHHYWAIVEARERHERSLRTYAVIAPESPEEFILRQLMTAPSAKWSLMVFARLKAIHHMRFCFPRKGCRIWRIYSHFGLKTRAVFCECGKEFK